MTTTHHINEALEAATDDLNDMKAPEYYIANEFDYQVYLWRAKVGGIYLVQSINWMWVAVDTIVVRWCSLDEPTSTICRTYKFPHLGTNNSSNEAYDRAMRGI